MRDVPCTVEDEEPHRCAERRGKELVLEPGQVRVEPGTCKCIVRDETVPCL